MALQIEQFTCHSDNFGVLMHDTRTGETALVDAPEERPILAAVERTGWTPTLILVTHHHGDHVEANLALKERFGLKIAGPREEAAKIPGIDETVEEGAPLDFAGHAVHVIATPGHTAGHVSYHLPESSLAFTGDTLFALGCGRMFEGTPQQFWTSLSRLRALPDDMRVYCAHEYTQSNARFAVTIETGNKALLARSAAIDAARAKGEATVPSLLGEEKETNPFLRVDVPAVQAAVGMKGGDPVAVFAEVRHRKDVFR
jgi:hydroxyacylglutathione hydrolase